jgi:aspartyl-tRNA(Asn)/glutamyl-tRNA(Gln) amidotransferase subunit B
MQEGSMRCDVNISVREKGSDVLGTRTEIKNMNSLKAIAAAIAYESQRHITALETGNEVLVQETRRWDDNIGETFSMRGKEEAADYRYFPNSEIMPIEISEAWIKDIRDNLPEPAHDKFIRMTQELGLSEYDSNIITGSKALSDIFDTTLKYFNKPKEVVNWIIVELLSIAKGDNKSEDDIKIDCAKFAKIMELVDKKIINRNVAKKILILVWQDGVDPEKYVEENQLGMVSDTSVVEKTIQDVLSEQTKSVNEYREGNKKSFNFLVGQVMKRLAGKADPSIVNSLLANQLDK